ncbi:Hypp8329 [Branchiostoma lanceolatum]|uniref:Hypp8329 protein n=1 Tax=Branchiostoma lanceolatum TaxID=7740 RepID=A0A8K0ED85_BRALA|nr:Hypp8329 [Branchiostoma lanceolatum]
MRNMRNVGWLSTMRLQKVQRSGLEKTWPRRPLENKRNGEGLEERKWGTWDWESIKQEVASWPNDKEVSWRAYAKEKGVHNKKGEPARNGGQIIQDWLIVEGIADGEIPIGERIVPKEFDKMVIDKDTGKVKVERFTVEGRKHPLAEVRARTLQEQKKYMRIRTDEDYDEMTADAVKDRLRELGEYREEDCITNMRNKLKQKERTRSFADQIQVLRDGKYRNRMDLTMRGVWRILERLDDDMGDGSEDGDDSDDDHNDDDHDYVDDGGNDEKKEVGDDDSEDDDDDDHDAVDGGVEDEEKGVGDDGGEDEEKESCDDGGNDEEKEVAVKWVDLVNAALTTDPKPDAEMLERNTGRRHADINHAPDVAHDEEMHGVCTSPDAIQDGDIPSEGAAPDATTVDDEQRFDTAPTFEVTNWTVARRHVMDNCIRYPCTYHRMGDNQRLAPRPPQHPGPKTKQVSRAQNNPASRAKDNPAPGAQINPTVVKFEVKNPKIEEVTGNALMVFGPLMDYHLTIIGEDVASRLLKSNSTGLASFY